MEQNAQSGAVFFEKTAPPYRKLFTSAGTEPEKISEHVSIAPQRHQVSVPIGI